MDEPRVCPHCGGELRNVDEDLDWDCECLQCGRGWAIDKNGNWMVFFNANKKSYTAEEAKRAQERWRPRGELRSKSSAEENWRYEAMMSEEAKAEEVAWIGMIALFVVGFLILLVLSLGIAFLWEAFT